MEYSNKISYKVYGRYALFSDPILRVGGEKCSYYVPTYQALIGITESVYWKPTFYWVIDRVRVMKPIQTQSKAVRPLVYHSDKNDLSIYTYLENVEYQVEAHFEWNERRADLSGDRNENKHFLIAKRMVERGGKRDIFLGTRECVGYVEPCVFGEGTSAYDGVAEMDLGVMYHGLDYPSATGKKQLGVRLAKIVMKRGIIEFPRPEDCTLRNENVRPYRLTEVKTSGDFEEDIVFAEQEGGL